MKLMTFEEEVKAKERTEIARSLIGLGSLTNEQIATVTSQTPEYIASLRQEVTV